MLLGASFIDRVGGTMIWPFFALYVTRKFGVGMTEAGVLLGIFSLAGVAGNMAGGALTDRLGRRNIVLFGLVFSALSSLVMGLLDNLAAFYILAAVVGFLGDIAGPAHAAMVADLLPESQRNEGFGLLRVVGNLAWLVGPTLGGALATRSYLYLFIGDAVTSLITAAIVYRFIPETRPEPNAGEKPSSLWDTAKGYRWVLADGLYMAFLLASMLMLVVYQQMYSTLSVFLRDVHGLPERQWGLLLSLDAAMVVLFQFWVARRIRPYPPMLMMALGTAFYLVGFTMYGFVSGYPLFVLAILIITVGEMIQMPVSQALAARFAPEEMRGRYMAFFNLSWTIPATVGPAAAGLVMDNFDPRWVWYAAGILSAVAAVSFLLLQVATRRRFAPAVEPTSVWS